MKVKIFFPLIAILILSGCNPQNKPLSKIRQMVDTIGFASKEYQVDSVLNRIDKLFADTLTKKPNNVSYRVAICPHDDYTYVGWHYPAVLRNIKAKTVIIFGVAHKARKFSLENKLIFDSFTHWQGPYSNIRVSDMREKILSKMPKDMVEVHDSMQIVEHSVESMLPMLQHFNPEVEIISILVPYMSFDRITEISKELANALNSIAKEENINWGKDFALLVTTDAVHYGDEEWGGKNYAPFGADSSGYQKAVTFEHEIISNCLTTDLTEQKIQRFFEYTVNQNDFKEYKWTWCGRYSVPLGLSSALYLNDSQKGESLKGDFTGYSTSIDHNSIPVEDIGMGKTAIANIHHWVGYASVGYR
ncbi:MAG: AmmeMemoRadiSam system protein B [Bacteroidales bacterium]